jgi:hypothetical protein
LASLPVYGNEITLPAGAVVYAKTLEEVTSRKKETSEGDLVQAVVWRDVLVRKEVVIEEGTPIVLKVSKVKKSNFAGVKGKLELRAFSTTATDGTHVPLIGGYDKSGKGKKALVISLAAIVFVPLIFIKGKQAVLESGTVFDAQVQATTELDIEAGPPRRVISLKDAKSLTAEILYDEIPEEGKTKALPLRIEHCGETAGDVAVVTVNEKEIPPIPIGLLAEVHDDDCTTIDGEIDLSVIGEYFTRGINRFEVSVGTLVTEVIMEVEL